LSKEEFRMPRVVKIEDVKKYLEIAEKVSWKKRQEIVENKTEKNWKEASEYWRGRLDSYVDMKYMILEKDDERERLRLDKKSLRNLE
jgi:hypothetical protein